MARIPLRHLAALCRRVGTAYNSGIHILRIWELESARGSAEHRQVMRDVHDHVARGESVADAMQACDGYFPPMTYELMRVGERTGRLEYVLFQLADHYDHLLALRREFIQGITRPALQLAIAVTVIGLLIWIMGMLSNQDLLGFGLMGTSGLIIYLVLVSLVAGVCTLFVMSLLRGWLGPTPVLLAMKVPGIGGCLRNMSLARLAWTLSLALDAGVDARNSMSMALRSTQNVFYMTRRKKVDRILEKGHEFHEALRSAGGFPDEFVDSLQAAEISGTHSESMMRLSKEYDERARHSSRILIQVASYAVWALTAGLIIFMIFRLFSFYLGAINEALTF